MKKYLSLLAVLALLCSPVDLMAAKGGGGGKPPQDEESPVSSGPINYELVALGSLGGSNVQIWDMNNHGDIVGMARIIDPETQTEVSHAFLCTTDNDGNRLPLIDLNSLIDPDSGWRLSHARAINENGQITGLGYLNGDWLGFRFTPGETPTVEAIQPLAGDVETEGYAINNNGDVVGETRTAINGSSRVFLFTMGTSETSASVSLLPIPGRPEPGPALVTELNGLGILCGTNPATGEAYRYDVYNGTPIENLGVFGDISGGLGISTGLAMNEFSEVVGVSSAGSQKVKGQVSTLWQPFLYTDMDYDEDGKSDGLLSVGATDTSLFQSTANSINDLGDILIYNTLRFVDTGEAFLVEDMISKETPSGLIAESYRHVNNSLEIAVEIINPNTGNREAGILIPISTTP